ncbi:acetylxylan esterase, partial [bacterium]|nr:acetylxylan esterase [bacterium]
MISATASATDLETVAAMGDLTTSPAVFTDDSTPGTTATIAAGDLKVIYYDGLDFDGNATRVHAWVGIPVGASAANPVPAVVLVHGGGGTSFKTWVEKWNERGYAAISMGLEGQTDIAATQTQKDAGEAVGNWLKHAMPGPARTGIYGDSAAPLTDQWMYHSLANTILANSLMRALPEVDSAKVGIMGTSWGGIITSTVIGIDDRFVFAVPTYGCGHLYDAKNLYGDNLGNNTLYREVWDPMVRIANATLPTLWFSWPGDFHFPMDNQAYTYHGTNGQRMVSLVPGMGHGHGPPWNRPESYDFADSVISSGAPWCVQDSLSETGNAVEIVFTSSRPLTEAMLISTTGTGKTGDLTWPEVAVDSFVESPVGTWTIQATLPAGTTGWFVNVKALASDLDADGSGRTDTFNYIDEHLIVSSDYQEVIALTLNPAAEFVIDHPVVNDQTTGSLQVAFTGPTNVEITEINITAESHAGAFSEVTGLPLVFEVPSPASSALEVQFDNTIASLTQGQFATGTMTIVWENLDGSTDQIAIPLKATVEVAAEICFDLDADWTSKTIRTFDTVKISDGAIVTLDEGGSIAGLNVLNGILQVNAAHQMILEGPTVISGNGVLQLNSGTVTTNGQPTTIDGLVTIAGGSLARDMTGVNHTIAGPGLIRMTSGSFAYTGGAPFDVLTLNTDLEISGGVLDFDSQVYFGQNVAREFAVVGDAASINIARFNQGPGGNSGTFRFALDDTGVSTIQVDAWMNLSNAQIQVDGSSYIGGPAEILLFDAINFVTVAPPGNLSITGFAQQGLDAAILQDQTNGKDWVQLILTANGYGTWAAGKSLSGEEVNTSANPDGDQLNNLQEFALGGDPLAADGTAILPSLSTDASAPEFSFRRRLDAVSQGLVYSLQTSTDLDSWGTDGLGAETVDPLNVDFETVTTALSATA